MGDDVTVLDAEALVVETVLVVDGTSPYVDDVPVQVVNDTQTPVADGVPVLWSMRYPSSRMTM